jgi:hypothetical protein
MRCLSDLSGSKLRNVCNVCARSGLVSSKPAAVAVDRAQSQWQSRRNSPRLDTAGRSPTIVKEPEANRRTGAATARRCGRRRYGITLSRHSADTMPVLGCARVTERAYARPSRRHPHRGVQALRPPVRCKEAYHNDYNSKAQLGKKEERFPPRARDGLLWGKYRHRDPPVIERRHGVRAMTQRLSRQDGAINKGLRQVCPS